MADTNINLNDYLDEVYKSPFNKSLCETILNKFVSAPDLYHQHGTVWNGKQNGTPIGSIIEPTAERQAYQLQPTVVTQNGAELTYRVYRDFLLKAQTLGIDVTNRVAEWGSALQFNYAPPIDLDKLANYSDYYWYDVENPSSEPQYITIENQCRKAKGIVDQYQVVLNTRGSTIEVQYIDIVANSFTVNNNYSEMFINGFVFFIKNSTNPAINQRYWTTQSSTYDITTNTTIIIVVDPITQQFPMIATIDLAPLLTVFEAKRNCKCYGSVGWDYAQWDDNQVGSLIWNTNMMLQITSSVAPVAPVQFQLWYDTTSDTLYQFNNEWQPVQNAFSLILSQTTGTHNWDLDTNCEPLFNSWTVKNYWLHINEVPNFEIAQKAQLPIIEYSVFAQLNNWVYYSPNWYYRSTIYDTFDPTTTLPSLFELINSINCEYVNTTTFNMPTTVYDLTNTFIPGYQFVVNNTVVSVIKSSYIQCNSNSQLLQTQVIIDGNDFTPGPTYAQIILADSPVAYWPLDETSGTIAYDQSGNGFNGTYAGGVSLGRPGLPNSTQAAFFDGISGNVTLNDVPLTSTTSVTIEGWVNLTGWSSTNTGHGSLLKCGGNNGYGVGVGADGNSWDSAGNYLIGLYEILSWNPAYPSTQVSITGWHHIVMTIEANSTSSFYLDGILVGTNGNSGIYAPTTITTIASDGNGRYLLGEICNVALYNKRLTSAQILAHFNATTITPGPIAISPLFTATGDKWEGYNQHWVFQGMTNPVPCSYQEQNIYQTTFNSKTLIATDQTYLYSLNPYGEQITVVTPPKSAIYTLDTTLQQVSLYGTNSTRVYLNGNRIFGAYNEIPASINGVTYVIGIQFDNVIVIKPYDIIEIYVGPDAQQDLGYNNLNIRTTLSDSQYKLNGNVNVSVMRYKIVDQLLTMSNQYPLFDIYDVDSSPLNEVSSIFKFATSDSEPINSYIKERIISSLAPLNFTFEQSLITNDNGPLRSYRLIPQGAGFNYFWYNNTTTELKIWNGNCWVDRVNIPSIGYIAPTISTDTPAPSSFQSNPYYYCSSTQQGYVYNRYINNWIQSAYTHVGADDPTLTTIWRPGLALQEYTPQYVDSNRNPVPIGSTDGLWEEPNQLLYNPMHQNMQQITYMDLYDHCNSIVNSQTAIPGLSNQVNTYYAKMSNQIDFGVGGTIREYNGSYDSFISSLNINQFINTKSVLQFAEVQYQFLVDMFIDTFVKQLPVILTSNSNDLYTDLGNFVITSILNTYQELSFSGDIYFDSTAYDSSSGIGMRNWIATLPIFGFVVPTLPYIINDPYTNIHQLICHDGHRYNLGMSLFTVNSICEHIISTPDSRTLPTISTFGIKSQLMPPTTISEFISAFNISVPISGKWWYTVADTQLLLYFFNVPIVGNSYSNYQPVGYPIGTLWLDTSTNTLRTNNGVDWVPVTTEGDGIITSGWVQVDVSSLLSDSLLQVETNLYDISQQNSIIIETDYIKTSTDRTTYYQYMVNSFLQFARNTQTYDFNTNSEYTSADPFTWNYTNSVIVNYPVVGYNGVITGSCWQNLYQQLFNTPYPHLEPWKLQGFDNIPSWWIAQYSSKTSGRQWDPQMWTNILAGQLPSGIIVTLTPSKYTYVPVNITSQTIGNYQPDSLLPPYFIPTGGIQSVFNSYSQIVNPSSNYTLYAPSPIFWAWTQTIDFQYSSIFNAFLMQPIRMFHKMWGNKFIKCNYLEVDDRTKVVYAHQNTVFHGDMISNTTTYAASGLNQWYVDYIRFYSYDLNATDLVDYWINWNVTLGYQTSGLLDTSTLTAYSPFVAITPQDYTIGYKKTDSIISVSTSSINLIANHVPPKYITYNNQSEWVFTITTPSSNLPGPIGYYGVQNYPVSISTQNNSLLIPFMFNIVLINVVDNCFDVKTDVTSYAVPGSTILIANTENINGIFNISSSQYNPLTGITSIYVTQQMVLPIGSSDYHNISGKVVFVSIPLPFETGDTVYLSSTKELPPPLQTNYPYVFVKWTFNGFVLAYNQADALAEKFISIVPTHMMGTLYVGKSVGQFISLGGANTRQTWQHYKIDTNVVNYTMPPFTINGVQNLINFLDGYKYVLENDIGIVTTDTAVDTTTGNTNGWQNEIEKAINWAYSLQNAKIFDLNMYPVTYIGNNQFEFTDQHIPSLSSTSTVCFSTQQQVPSPLVDGVPYYIVMTSANTFVVAYTYLNALNGTAVSVTSGTTTPLYIYEYIQQNSQLPMTEVNPYKQSIGITSKFGILASLSESVNINLQMSQGVSDQYGNTIPASLLNVLRNETGVEISIRPQYTDTHLGTINALFDGYEHIVSFNDSTTTGNLIFNPYLGLTISSILLDFYRSTQANFKPDMGGYFIFNDKLIRNYETSTLNMRDYFATFRLSETNIATSLARQMIGFHGDIGYMTEFDVPVASQFEFWKGLIHNKGTEAAVSAFLNSSEYSGGYIDEYWAIQVAEYGDSHKNIGIKIITTSADGNYSDLMFKFTTDIVQPNTNFINITPTDQTRWYDYPRVAQALTKDFNEYKLLQ
jgi:hypothetical protein